MSVIVEGTRAFYLGSAARLIDESREVAWAERYVTSQPDVKWMVANFVEADNANGNGHIFPLDDLRQTYKSIEHKPLNFLHHDAQIVGVNVGAELLEPGGETAGGQVVRPHVETVSAFYHYYFPKLFDEVIEPAHKNGSLYVSMEAVPKTLTCRGVGSDAGCGREFAYHGRQHDTYCFVPGQLVSMADGTHKPIEAVSVGDLVLTDGEPAPVTHVHMRQYDGPITRLWWHGSCEPVIATDNHPVLSINRSNLGSLPVRRAVRDRTQWGWQPAGDVTRGDIVKLTYPDVTRGFEIDLLELCPQAREVAPGRVAFRAPTGRPTLNTMPRFIHPSAELGTLVGWYLAEGSPQTRGPLGNHRVTSFALNDAEDDYASTIQLALDKFEAGQLHRYQAGRRVSWRVHNGVLTELLKHLAGEGSRYKRLAAPMMLAPRSCQTALLTAYAQGDGWLDPADDIELRTTSPVLARQLVLLYARVYRIVPLLHHEVRAPGGPKNRELRRDCWFVHVGAGNMKSRWLMDENFYAASIKRVEHDTHQGPVYNLEVAEQHTFAAADMVVHNCAHLNSAGSRKVLNRPHFTASGIIVPPVRPGWSRADVTELSKLIETNLEEAQVAYDQIATEFPHLEPRQWEQMMAQMLAAARPDGPTTTTTGVGHGKVAPDRGGNADIGVPVDVTTGRTGPPVSTWEDQPFDDNDADDIASALPDGSWMVLNRDDLAERIQRASSDGNGIGVVRRHLMRRADALGAMDMIPKEWHDIYPDWQRMDAGLLSNAGLLASLGYGLHADYEIDYEIARDFNQARREALAKKGLALPDGSFPIVTVGDLRNAIRAIGRAAAGTRRTVMAHIRKRAVALGATAMLPADWKTAA